MGYDKTDKTHYLKGGSQYPVRLFKDIVTKAGENDRTFKKPENVKELGGPIELEAVKSLSARYTFKAMGLITVQLKWDIQKDDRVVYRIYEKKDGKDKLLDSVKGKATLTYRTPICFQGFIQSRSI